MFRSPRHAYESVARTSTSNRDLESAALYKAARLLEEARQQWPAHARLDEALAYNRRLWTFFQGELAAPDHPMPREMRVNLLRLSSFVDRRMIEILASPSPDKLVALIDINRQIAAGLATRELGQPAA